MQDYTRIVSYMHTYENNEKSKNVGFAKIEAKGSNGHLRLQINEPKLPENKSFLVFFLTDAASVRGIHIGECRAEKGRIISDIRFDAGNIANSDVKITDLQGVYLSGMDTPSLVFASAWTDACIRPDRFHVIGQREEPVVLNNAVDTVNVENRSEEKQDAEKQSLEELNTEIQSEEKQDTEKQSAEKQEEKAEDKVNSESETEIKEEVDELFKNLFETININKVSANEDISENDVPDNVLNKMDLEMPPKSPWEKLCCKYPKVIAFEGEPCRLCLKIDLKDLGEILGKNKEAGGNGFLLHSYYRYKYMILVENKEDSEGKSCILGIPGIYCRNEAVMAKACGYGEFCLAKSDEHLNGRFGYWTKKICL